MTSRFSTRTRVVAVGTAAAALTLSVAGAAGARAPWWPELDHGFAAHDDSFRGSGTVTGSVLRNDDDATAVVRHTAPQHGTVAIAADGTFTYTPEPGFHGDDSFTYGASDAVELFGSHLPPLATFPGYDAAGQPTTVTISGGAYGSALTPAPGRPGQFYGLTDRGPNADHPDGHKTEPMGDTFTPMIGLFALQHGEEKLVRSVTLKGPRALGGTPYSGRPTSDTAEQIYDLDQSAEQFVAKDAYGYDPEGLVALADGSFWVSDEYGPYLTHFDKDGYELGRLTPYPSSPDNAGHKILGTLPAELAHRVNNKGMEGLAVTPDGRTLVGIMQSALQQPDLGSVKAANVSPVRIVTVDLRTYATKQFLYLLTDPGTTKSANSEITALSATKFLVDERDGNFEPFAFKQLYEIDLAAATDVTGLTLDGKSVEAYVGAAGTNAALAALTKAGVQPVAKQVYVDLGALVSQLDPTGGFFSSDKVEGVATSDGGQTLYVSNDSDFGINTVNTDHGAWTLNQKLVGGKPDDGAVLKVDTSKLPAVVRTATVTVHVR